MNNEKTAVSKCFDHKTIMIISGCSIKWFDMLWSKNYKIPEIFNTPETDANPAAIPSVVHVPATSTAKHKQKTTISIIILIQHLGIWTLI